MAVGIASHWKARSSPTRWRDSEASLIPPDRQFLAATNETGGGTLESFNGGLQSQLAGQPMPHETPFSDRPALARVLLTHTNMLEQLGRATEILRRLGLPDLRVGAGQTVQFEDVQGYFQGTGVRGLYPIVAALTDPELRAILIDEPELSLEPTLQRALRDVLVEHANSGRAVIVSTHSHLFLDRKTFDANLIVSREDAGVEGRAGEE